MKWEFLGAVVEWQAQKIYELFKRLANVHIAVEALNLVRGNAG
jgi:hypothetical protein